MSMFFLFTREGSRIEMSFQGVFKRGEERMFEGNPFQSVGAVTEKALLPL